MSASPGPQKEPATIKWLTAPTSDVWLEQAIAHPLELLIDHAHCERKAAGAVVQLMFRYLCEPGLGEVLSPLAREELEHFERVLTLIKARGRYLEPLPAPPYGAALAKQIRRNEPERMLDSFLVAGLIEARSHERMSLLAAHMQDEELRQLYADLLASEARHFGLYWLESKKRFPIETVEARLKELSITEAQILSGIPAVGRDIRFHSAGVVTSIVCSA